MMLFAIDFDKTWTAAPRLMRTIATLIHVHGHKTVMVTARTDTPAQADPVREEIADLMPIVFTAGKLKRPVAFAAGFDVDVWIDDDPGGIGNSKIL